MVSQSCTDVTLPSTRGGSLSCGHLRRSRAEVYFRVLAWGCGLKPAATMANVPVCSIDPELKPLLHKFKFRKEKNIAAIVLKVNSEKKMVVLDEEYQDTTIEEVAGELPEHQPRYVVLSYEDKRSDGVVSYPLIFIFCSPLGCKPELQMMYAGTKNSIVKAAEATKVFEIRSTEELTEAYILGKLQLFR